MSSAAAPRSPCSSATVKTSSTPTGPGSAISPAPISISTVTAALLSAPRIVSPALRRTPPSSTTSISSSWGTVSRWAKNEIQPSAPSRPGIVAIRLPAPARAGSAASSSRNSIPSSRSSAPTASATRRSSPVTLGISQRRTKRSTSLSSLIEPEAMALSVG